MIFGFSFKGRRQLQDDETCGRNVFKSTDPSVKQVTTEMAVKAWYD